MTSEGPDGNPLRSFDEEPFTKWLEELGDGEVIDLLNRVSADLKRRNLLMVPEGPEGQEAVRKIVDVITGRRG